MSLKIVRAYEPLLVEQIVVALYGGPGMRKTTVAFTADDPISIDFDLGAHRAPNRKDAVRPTSWKEAAAMTASDFAGYKTAIVDTAGRALDLLAAQLIAEDPKNSTPAGALSLQGYGALKAVFTTWLNRLRSYGLDVVLIAHASEERKGDEIIERLDVQGGSRGEIHKSADAMGRLFVSNGENWLDFSPTNAAFGKNPGNMKPLVFSNPDKDPRFLANVIAEIKRVLNAQSEATRAMRDKIEKALEEFRKLEGAEAFTAAAEDLVKKNAEHPIKAALITVAGEKGLVYSRTEKKFIVPAAAPAAPSSSAPTSDDPSFFSRGEQQGSAPAAEGGRRKQSTGGTRARR